MPLDVTVRYNNGEEEMIYIPLQMMRWEKSADHENWTVADDWAWAYPTYKLNIEKPLSEIESIEIDESQLMADVNRDDNLYTAEEASTPEEEE